MEKECQKNIVELHIFIEYWLKGLVEKTRQEFQYIDDALDMVGLDGLQSVPFAHLSTGQRRRIGIARLLVSYRPIWILDEPTSGLDAASEKQFADLMNVHLEDGGIIIAATHIPLGLENAPVVVLGESSGELDK